MKRQYGSAHSLRRQCVIGMGVALLVIGALGGCADPADLAAAQQLVGTWVMTAPDHLIDCRLELASSTFVLVAADESWTVTGTWNVRSSSIGFRRRSFTVDGVSGSDDTLNVMMAVGLVPPFFADPTKVVTTYGNESDTLVIVVTSSTDVWEHTLIRW